MTATQHPRRCFWYGKILAVYFTVAKVKCVGCVWAEIWSFYFLVLFEISDDFDRTQIKPYPILRVTDSSVIEIIEIILKKWKFGTEFSKTTLPRSNGYILGHGQYSGRFSSNSVRNRPFGSNFQTGPDTTGNSRSIFGLRTSSKIFRVIWNRV